jgi:DNA repair protein RadC
MSILSYATAYKVADTDLVLGEGDTQYVLCVRDLPREDKPREKLLAVGPSNLTHAELIAVLLGFGTKREEVMAMAHRIMREYGEQAIMHEKDPARLSEALDIPLVKACQIIAGFELGRRAYQLKEGRPVYIRTAQQAYEYVKGMRHLQKEQLRGLYLNSRFQVIHEEVISIGSLTANIVHPREVFRPALEYGAVAVIIAHNHPSGSCEATEDDECATLQLKEAGQILGIDLLDHLIIAGNSFATL